jgi:hypothetical protein
MMIDQKSVLRIRRFRMNLCLLDPDPLVCGSDPDPSIIINSKKNLDSYCFVPFYDFLSLKNDVNVVSKSNKQKNLEKINV